MFSQLVLDEGCEPNDPISDPRDEFDNTGAKYHLPD